MPQLRCKEAILETTRKLLLYREFQIQDALGRFVSAFLSYA
jgi:hypothetical protein